MNKIFLALGLGILVFAACNTTPILPTYKATLNGANEKPTAVTTAGTGTATWAWWWGPRTAGTTPP